MKQVAEDRLFMSATGFTQAIGPDDKQMRIYHESLVAAEFDRCHPGDSFQDMKRRARFSKEDQGLLTDWMALAAVKGEELAREQGQPVGKNLTAA